ncbi:hypothetical protein FOA52_002232 [Chlamydomonas sp. UWO 241]|nr:hypothetical protein FOA52_002232 [Chlamydomonas sp. UWO 241]
MLAPVVGGAPRAPDTELMQLVATTASREPALPMLCGFLWLQCTQTPPLGASSTAGPHIDEAWVSGWGSIGRGGALMWAPGPQDAPTSRQLLPWPPTHVTSLGAPLLLSTAPSSAQNIAQPSQSGLLHPFEVWCEGSVGGGGIGGGGGDGGGGGGGGSGGDGSSDVDAPPSTHGDGSSSGAMVVLAAESELGCARWIAALSEACAPTSQRPTLTQRYVVEFGSLLGSGLFSVVVRGWMSNGTAVAVKLIKPDAIAGYSNVIEREVAVWSAIGEHPHVAGLYDALRSETGVYYVSELCLGGSLLSSLAHNAMYCEKDAARVMGQVLKGLAHIHSRGAVHCDLKPENVCMASSDPSSPVKLIDFSLSAFVGRPCSPGGTPEYVAPELLLYPDHYAASGCGPSVDMWSVGVLVFYLLSGTTPFAAPSVQDIMARVRTGVWSFMGSVWGTVSEHGKDLISSLLQVAPDRRPSAVAALSHPWFGPLDRSSSKPLASTSAAFRVALMQRQVADAQAAVCAQVAAQAVAIAQQAEKVHARQEQKVQAHLLLKAQASALLAERAEVTAMAVATATAATATAEAAETRSAATAEAEKAEVTAMVAARESYASTSSAPVPVPTPRLSPVPVGLPSSYAQPDGAELQQVARARALLLEPSRTGSYAWLGSGELHGAALPTASYAQLGGAGLHQGAGCAQSPSEPSCAYSRVGSAEQLQQPGAGLPPTAHGRLDSAESPSYIRVESADLHHGTPIPSYASSQPRLSSADSRPSSSELLDHSQRRTRMVSTGEYTALTSSRRGNQDSRGRLGGSGSSSSRSGFSGVDIAQSASQRKRIAQLEQQLADLRVRAAVLASASPPTHGESDDGCEALSGDGCAGVRGSGSTRGSASTRGSGGSAPEPCVGCDGDADEALMLALARTGRALLQGPAGGGPSALPQGRAATGSPRADPPVVMKQCSAGAAGAAAAAAASVSAAAAAAAAAACTRGTHTHEEESPPRRSFFSPELASSSGLAKSSEHPASSEQAASSDLTASPGHTARSSGSGVADDYTPRASISSAHASTSGGNLRINDALLCRLDALAPEAMALGSPMQPPGAGATASGGATGSRSSHAQPPRGIGGGVAAARGGHATGVAVGSRLAAASSALAGASGESSPSEAESGADGARTLEEAVVDSAAAPRLQIDTSVQPRAAPGGGAGAEGSPGNAAGAGAAATASDGSPSNAGADSTAALGVPATSPGGTVTAAAGLLLRPLSNRSMRATAQAAIEDVRRMLARVSPSQRHSQQAEQPQSPQGGGTQADASSSVEETAPASPTSRGILRQATKAALDEVRKLLHDQQQRSRVVQIQQLRAEVADLRAMASSGSSTSGHAACGVSDGPPPPSPCTPRGPAPSTPERASPQGSSATGQLAPSALSARLLSAAGASASPLQGSSGSGVRAQLEQELRSVQAALAAVRASPGGSTVCTGGSPVGSPGGA